MIDYLTLRLPGRHIDQDCASKLSDHRSIIQEVDSNGELAWAAARRESIGSGHKKLTIQYGTDLKIEGSPARLQGPNNVFGSGDPIKCATVMINWISDQLGIGLPTDLRLWDCLRLDIAHNYYMGGESLVREALQHLKHAKGGRRYVSTEEDSVSWSRKSPLKSAVAYPKGPELKRRTKQGKADASKAQIQACKRLLRIELRLGHKYWKKAAKPWHEHTESELDKLFQEFFAELIGKVEVDEVDDLKALIISRAPSQKAGEAAYKTWGLVQGFGLEETLKLVSPATWYRHRRILFDAGLSHADLQARRVVPLRRRSLVLEEPVRSWEELEYAVKRS